MTAGVITHESPQAAKERSTLFAALALRGFAAHTSTAGGYLVTRWGLVRHCADVDALRDFARVVGATT